MTIGGLIILGPDGQAAPGQEVLELAGRRLAGVSQFRRRLAEVPFGAGFPVWVDDAGFRLAAHLGRSTVEAPGGGDELAHAVLAQLRQPLDRRRPLWSLDLLHGLTGNRAALLLRWHHCLADGMSAMAMGRTVFDRPGRGPASAVTGSSAAAGPSAVPVPSPAELVIDAWSDRVVRSLEAGLSLLEDQPGGDSRSDRARRGFMGLLGIDPPPPSPFRLPVGTDRRLRMVQLPLAQLRSTRRRLGATTNALLLAAIAAGLSRLMAAAGAADCGAAVRALVPASSRHVGLSLGNLAAHYAVDLPVGPMDGATRLALVQSVLADDDREDQVAAVEAWFKVWDSLPPDYVASSTRALAEQPYAHLVYTCLLGPESPKRLGGFPVTETQAVVPLGRSLPLAVAAVMLGGSVNLSFIADPASIGDLDVLVAGTMSALADFDSVLP